MIKRTLPLFIACLALFGCDKDDTKNVSPCDLAMKELFKDDLQCTIDGGTGYNLSKSNYEGKTIYYPTPISGCENCLHEPPKFGYTCEKEKIEIEDYRKLTAVALVYDSCKKAFVE